MDAPPPSEDVRRGDDAVFAAVYGPLRRFAAVVAPIEVDPDDLVQEALSRTLSQVELASLTNPLGYLRQAVVRIASNERRRLGRHRRALERLPRQDPQPVAYPSDLTVLDRLSPKDRAAVYLAVIDGASARDVAAVIGGSAAAARMRLSRSLRRLQEYEKEANDE